MRAEAVTAGVDTPAEGARRLADERFANEADPAFRRRARILAGWIGDALAARPQLAVADIGCGRGFYLPLYADLGVPVVVAVEADAWTIAAAAPRAGGAWRVCAAAEGLPLADASVHIVVMSEVLEHLVDERPALAEARRILRPGGQLLVSVPNANYPALWDPINWSLERMGCSPIRHGVLAGIWANHERLYSVDGLSEVVGGAGFDVREAFVHTHACLPFVHNVVYGLGKTLMDAGRLPDGWRASAERGEGRAAARARGFDPVRAGIGLVGWFDRRNSDAEPPGTSTVNIMLRAGRPCD